MSKAKIEEFVVTVLKEPRNTRLGQWTEKAAHADSNITLSHPEGTNGLERRT